MVCDWKMLYGSSLEVEGDQMTGNSFTHLHEEPVNFYASDEPGGASPISL